MENTTNNTQLLARLLARQMIAIPEDKTLSIKSISLSLSY